MKYVTIALMIFATTPSFASQKPVEYINTDYSDFVYRAPNLVNGKDTYKQTPAYTEDNSISFGLAKRLFRTA